MGSAAQRKVRFTRESQLARGGCLPSEAGLLRDFAKFFFGCFPTVDVAVDTFDTFKTGRINTVAFLASMKRMKFQGDAKGVFRALDVDSTGFIGKKELQILNRFHPHPTPELEAAARPEPWTAKGVSKAPAHSASQSQHKMRSSSTPNLAAPERREDSAQSFRTSVV